MRNRRGRTRTLLGEAFAMRESEGWQAVSDTMHIQEEIERRRRRTLLLVGLGVMTACGLLSVLFYLFH